MSAVERASEASSAEQANELAVQANEQTDERVAQYPDFWLFCPNVQRFSEDAPISSII